MTIRQRTAIWNPATSKRQPSQGRQGYWRVLAILLTTLLLAWMSAGYWILPETQLILTVESSCTDPALLYVDDGKGLESVPSLLNSYQSQHPPTRMFFAIDLDPNPFIRWDPVPYSGAEAIEIRVHEIALRISPLATPIPVPLAGLVPIRGVDRQRVAGPGSPLQLTIPPNTHDPMMELRLPAHLIRDAALARRDVGIRLVFIAFGTLFLGLLLYRMIHSRSPVATRA